MYEFATIWQRTEKAEKKKLNIALATGFKTVRTNKIHFVFQKK